MKKYETPIIEIDGFESHDVITASIGASVKIDRLEGIDKEDEKSAIFDANFWINMVV